MKKVIALIVAALLALALVGCGSKSDQDTPTEPESEEPETIAQKIMGFGYKPADSPIVTDEVKALVAKASEKLDGADYAPVAYLASQLVAGKNHRILCTITPVVPDAASTYAIVTIYEDLNGNAEITDIQNSTVSAPAPYDPENPISGGYGTPTTPEITDEVKKAVEKANEGIDGVTYEAKALLAQQVVAGMNYSVLCKGTPTTPDAESFYVIAVIYADLEGGAEFTSFESFGDVTE